jgi:tight adherence protein B
MPRLRDVSFLIQQSGTDWTVTRYVLLTVGAGVAFGAALLLLTLNPLLGAGGAVVGALLPDLYLRTKGKRRLNRFEEQFPEAMDLLGRAIRAGHPLSAGLRMVADEMADPTATEFRQVFEEQRFGLPFEDALLSMADRVDLVDVRIFITAVLIQREVGGNLAEILDKIATTVRSRFTLKRQLKVYTAQGRISGYALVALPIMTGVALYFIDPEYVSMLWTESVGRLMVGVVLVMWFIGILWIRRIISIEI